MSINHEQRAFLAWPVLTRVAADPRRPSITYGELAAEVGVHHRAVRYILGLIQDYCLSEKLPPLTILVVNGQNGLPGSGFIAWDADNLEEGFRQVRGYRWELRENPFGFAAEGNTENELAEKLVLDPTRALEIYALVKVRGAAQSIFRHALLRAYGERCAFCGLSFREALQAAHIVPWGECGASQRMAVGNGLLLCATHHRMFDAGLMTLGPDHTVQYQDPDSEDRHHTASDRIVSVDLDGKPAFLPDRLDHRPSSVLLRAHHERAGWDFG